MKKILSPTSFFIL